MKKICIIIITLRKYSSFSDARTTRLVNSLISLFGEKRLEIYYVGINGLFLRGKRIKDTYFEKYFFTEDGSRILNEHYLNLGDKGCSLSHICALKMIQIRKIYKDVFILEEDAIPRGKFDSVAKKLPEDYHLAALHSYSELNFFDQRWPGWWKSSIGKEVIRLRGGNPLMFSQSMGVNRRRSQKKNNKRIFTKIIYPMAHPIGAHAYIVNGRKINEIIEELLPLGSSIDHHLWSTHHSNLNKYIINSNIKLFAQPDPVSIRHALDKVGKNLLRSDQNTNQC